MASTYIVKQGDCLSKIASQFGFPKWKVIYDCPENSSFRELRPDPNVIFPGDELFIPDPDVKDESGATERRHEFKVHGDPTLLRIKLEDEDGKPFAHQSYELVVGSQSLRGNTDGSGLLEQEIQPGITSGQLIIWKHEKDQLPKGITWMLELGSLDPLEEITGVQARLNNMGYDSGPVDGIQGPITTAAVKDFQEDNGLKVDGIVGPKTRAKLKEIHGC